MDPQRTYAARRARKALWDKTEESERKRIGLRLFAIYSGQQSAKAYKARGLDSFVHARAALAKKHAAQKKQDSSRSKQLPIG